MTNKKILLLVIFILTLLLPHVTVYGEKGRNDTERKVAAVLDDFHKAASEADEPRYLGHMAEKGVFLGTDATERWTREEFRKYVHPYFSRGRGWTYIPRERNIMFSKDGNVAWFHERLHNEKYGEVRGTGVLQKINGVWKIFHYNLVFTIPNPVAGKVVDLIQENQKSKKER